MKTDLVFRADKLLSFDDYDANLRRQMYWSGVWAAGGTYEANEVVTDIGWLMIANTETQERPAPQTMGQEFLASDISPEAPPEFTGQSETSAAIRFGQRYTFPDAAFVRGLVFYVAPGTEGMRLGVFLRRDPLGVATIEVLVPEFIISPE
ncbi:unnamed protein product, partial [marine sediment metagenome]